VLLRHGKGEASVCAVDWETAGIGPGLLDLAALVSGWAEEFANLLARAYYDVNGPGSSGCTSFEDFITTLDYCRLHLAVQWLGWCADWSPPPEHKLDWLREARRIAQRLQL
jgi:thiamine kinase-like enzyme